VTSPEATPAFAQFCRKRHEGVGLDGQRAGLVKTHQHRVDAVEAGAGHQPDIAFGHGSPLFV